MSYRPEIGDRLTINGSEYEFAKFQGAADFAMDVVHAQEGRKGIVYRILSSNGQSHALKIFFPHFRTPRILNASHQLANYKSVRGLTVCDRSVIDSEENCEQLERYPELQYAVLMPWISGQTWFDVVVSQYQGDPITFTRSQSYDLALVTSGIMADIEDRGLAHCDISNGNVIFDQPRHMVELIDVEDMYGPGFIKPKRLPAGSKGYAHPSLQEGSGEWSPRADRFASAVLLAEFLCWYLPEVRELVSDDTYFTGDDMGRKCPRYFAMYENLTAVYSPIVGELFRDAWLSTRLDDCPMLRDWAEGLASVEGQTLPILEVTPDSLDFGTIAQMPVARDLSLANSGRSMLTGTISVADGPWLSVVQNSFSLAPGAGRKIEVTANPLADQRRDSVSFGNLRIESNGGDVEVLAEARHLAPAKKKGRKLRTLFSAAIYLSLLSFLLLLTVASEGEALVVTFPAFLIVMGVFFYRRRRGRRAAKQKTAPLPKAPKTKKRKPIYQGGDLDKIVIPKQKTAKKGGSRLQTEVLVVGVNKKWAKKSGKAIKSKGYRVATGDKKVNVNSAVIGVPRMILFGPMELTAVNIKGYRNIAAKTSGPKLVVATRDADASRRIIKENLMAEDYILGDEVKDLADWVNKILSRTHFRPQGGAAKRVGSMVVDPDTRQVSLGGRPVDLTDIEFDILLTLVENLGFVTYETIGRQVWGSAGRKAATDIFIERLRRKLAAGNVRIANVEDMGYMAVVAD